MSPSPECWTKLYKVLLKYLANLRFLEMAAKKYIFIKNLGAECIWGTLAAIQLKIFYFPISYLKSVMLYGIESILCLIILLAVSQLVREHYGFIITGLHFWVEVRVSTAPVQKHIPRGQDATNTVSGTGSYEKNSEYVPNLRTVEVSVVICPLFILTYTCCVQDVCWLTCHACQEYEVQESKHTGTETCHPSHYSHEHTHYLKHNGHSTCDILSILHETFRSLTYSDAECKNDISVLSFTWQM